MVSHSQLLPISSTSNMKVFVGLSVLMVLAVAEPPPSNSYLPPSSRSSNGGYSSGGPSNGLPQVVAARSGQGHGGGGFGRSGFHGNHGGAQGRSGGQYDQGNQGYDQNSQGFGRSSFDNGGEPAQYNFGYNVNDDHEGTDFGHHEEREDQKAHGEYHVVLPDGRKQTVSYEADERGFKPHISYEDTDASARNGGYDGNAQNGGGHHGNGFNNARSAGYN